MSDRHDEDEHETAPMRPDFATEIQSEQRIRTARWIVRDIQNMLKDYVLTHPRESVLRYILTSHDPQYSATDLYSLAPYVRLCIADTEVSRAWPYVNVAYRHCWWGSPIPICGLPPRHTLTVSIRW